jgi:hypothetical protein
MIDDRLQSITVQLHPQVIAELQELAKDMTRDYDRRVSISDVIRRWVAAGLRMVERRRERTE